MSFAQELKQERERLGLTQAGADAVLDTCRGQVAAWESQRNTPHVLTQEGVMARLRRRETPPPCTRYFRDDWSFWKFPPGGQPMLRDKCDAEWSASLYHGLAEFLDGRDEQFLEITAEEGEP